MKKITLLIGFVFISLLLAAQSNYNEAIQQGEDAQKRQDYTTAINKYLAAEAFDPSKKEIVLNKVQEVFKNIDDLRKEIEKARKDIKKETSEKSIALTRAEKLINVIDFYDGKYAVSSTNTGKGRIYYFIDKKGKIVNKLGYWLNAKLFDKELGLAEVTKYGGLEGISTEIVYIDTLGIEYASREMYKQMLRDKFFNNLETDPSFTSVIFSTVFLREAGDKFIQEKEFEKAEKCYLMLIKEEQQLNEEVVDFDQSFGGIDSRKEADDEMLKLLSEIADKFHNAKAYSQAIKFYLGAMKMVEQYKEDRNFSKNYFFLSYNIGYSYINMNECEKAEDYYKICLAIGEQMQHDSIISDKSKLGKISYILANCYKTQQEYDKSEFYYQKSLLIFRELYNSDISQTSNVAIILNNLGENYNLQKKYEESNACYLEYLEYINTLAKEEPIEYQSQQDNILYKIGLNYGLSEKYKDAENYLLQCLKIRKELTKENPDDFPSDVYDVLHNLCALYSQTKTYPMSIHYINTMNDLLLKYKERIDYEPHLAQNYGNLSWYYLFTKEYIQSEQSALQALELDRTSFAKINLAHALLFQNRFSEAEKIYKELSQTVMTDNETYTQTLLDDFDRLEKEGVIPEEHKADVEKIRKMLQGE